MSKSENKPPIVINSAYLSTLYLPQLSDLLSHRTQLLILAKNAGILDLGYIETLKIEIETIQAQIGLRKT